MEPDMLFHIALASGRYGDPLCLGRHYGQVYSQNGEDGMIAEAFRRIGTKSRFFVEIGIESGIQSNTRLLLESGWRGVWIESALDHIDAARSAFASFIAEGALKIIGHQVMPANIDELLAAAGVPASFDFPSLDIDQHTAHVWRAMRAHAARVHCIEYNAAPGGTACLEVPLMADVSWDGTNWYGASLAALERIGAEKPLSLVGCDLLGVNAFFVDQEAAEGRFQAPFTAAFHWEPLRHSQVAHRGHAPSPVARRWLAAG